MEFLTDLWLPIVLSAVFVFLASSIIHMVIPIHRGDYDQLADEDAILATMRDHYVQPGNYHFPFCNSMKDMGSEQMIEKYNHGPVGFVSVLPNGPMNMGKSLIQWFVYTLVVSAFVAYLASFSMAPGAEYRPIFRMAGTAAFLGYGIGAVLESIWKGQKWSTSFKFVFDGLVYALVTGGTFGWLWPDAM